MVIGFILLGSLIGTFVGLVGWAIGAMTLMTALAAYVGFGVGGAVVGSLLIALRGVSASETASAAVSIRA